MINICHLTKYIINNNIVLQSTLAIGLTVIVNNYAWKTTL
jgi:hypothetical protein